ncbi:MAG TPA: carboxypeptidase-like regulatory domain-containing protein [Thermoanaerobaculia bacterium]|nr:carboxypeptidase-like regulatory domain-containing protein [Thermoanaerobaculia bacterium]
MRFALPLAIPLACCVACTAPPPPTPNAQRLAHNARATVEGRVTDTDGRPVAGVRVQAVPGADILWSPPETTDESGRFCLVVHAPAEYVFLIFEGSEAVITPSPRDPARVRVFVEPGEAREGVELTLLRTEREELLERGRP